MINRRGFLLNSAALAAASSLPLEAQRSEQSASAGQLPPAIAALKSRRGEAKPITLAERQQRYERARQIMKREKIGAICITGGTSLEYFTGISWGQSERLLAFLLPANGAPFIVCPVFEEGRVRERLGMGQIPDGNNTKVYTWNEDADPYVLVAKGLRDAGLSTGNLGMEERVQFVFAQRIGQACPTLKIVSAIPVVAGCRSIKSQAELGLIQMACNITLSVYEAVYKSIHPGMTNNHVVDLVNLAYARVGVKGEVSCQVGVYSALPHGSLMPEVIKENDMVLLDDGCFVEGYQSDITRSFVIGKPTDKQKKVFDIVHKAQSAALAAARPGVQCQAIDIAARKVVTDAGFGPDYKYFSHRLGHGLGMDIHEWPYLVRGNTQPLEKNMCFSDEPGIYIKGEFGIRLEDDWYVTESGGKMFTPQSPSLENPFGKA